MTAEQATIVVLAAAVAVAALVGALLIARATRRAGSGLRLASERLDQRSLTLPANLTRARASLATIDVQAEHALWALGNADDRMGRAMADLRSMRVSSDTLRVRMIEGRLTIARLRQLVRLMITLSEMRRAFL